MLRALSRLALVSAEEALLGLLRHLDSQRYDFVATTPATHERVLARDEMEGADRLRAFFGWNRAFRPEQLPEPVLTLLRAARCLAAEGDRVRSGVRVARLGDRLFLHSAFPTDSPDAVFFGPDTYRFVRFAGQVLAADPRPVSHLVDLGAGSGAGAIALAGHVPGARLTLVDRNPEALRLAGINARAAGLAVNLVEAGSLSAVDGEIDLVIANPPFMADAAGRAYRDGGGRHGADLSLAWAGEAARRLKPGGRLILYTGAAIVGGEDRMEPALCALLAGLGCTCSYEVIDVDIFGEELDHPAYRDVDRIAAVGLVAEKTGARTS